MYTQMCEMVEPGRRSDSGRLLGVWASIFRTKHPPTILCMRRRRVHTVAKQSLLWALKERPLFRFPGPWSPHECALLGPRRPGPPSPGIYFQGQTGSLFFLPHTISWNDRLRLALTRPSPCRRQLVSTHRVSCCIPYGAKRRIGGRLLLDAVVIADNRRRGCRGRTVSYRHPKEPRTAG